MSGMSSGTVGVPVGFLRTLIKPLHWQIFPALAFLLLLFVVPVASLLGLSFLNKSGGITTEHYARLVDQPVYASILWITVRTAFWTTLLCILGGYPIAYLLSKTTKSAKNLLVIFVLMPFWTSFLVRTFAWIVLLGKKGAINQLLQALHIIDAPVRMIYDFVGVLIGMTHALMPLAVLIMLSVMEGIDRNLSNAAATMGAKGGKCFWKIYFPLSMPGVAAAAILVFITSVGVFITPALLGGARDTMIVQLIIFQIREVLNWHFAGAIGVLLLVVLLLVFVIYNQIFGLSALPGGEIKKNVENRQSHLILFVRKIGGLVTTLLAEITDAIGSFFYLVRMFQRNRTSNHKPRFILWTVTLLLIGFLALPTFFIIPVSFTAESFLTWPPRGFSYQWYDTAFKSSLWPDAAIRSLLVAVSSAFLGMLFAVPCAFALARQNFVGKSALFTLLVSPMIVPHIFIAVGLFFLYSKVGLTGTTAGLILGHTVLVIPYIVITVLAVVKGYDQNLDLAASTLGANTVKVFWRVTLPVIRAGMIAAFMFAFIISFDELTIALFVTGGTVTTLPKLMYEDAILSVNPTLAAVSTLLLIFMSAVILVSEFVRRRGP